MVSVVSAEIYMMSTINWLRKLTGYSHVSGLTTKGLTYNPTPLKKITGSYLVNMFMNYSKIQPVYISTSNSFVYMGSSPDEFREILKERILTDRYAHLRAITKYTHNGKLNNENIENIVISKHILDLPAISDMIDEKGEWKLIPYNILDLSDP